MNKADLIDRVANELKSSKTEASRIVEVVIGGIRDGIRHDEKVVISGFGTFVRRTRPPRNGVHPITKEPMLIEAKATCGFRPSATLKSELTCPN
jgi:nucleoid DNA-binding protein